MKFSATFNNISVISLKTSEKQKVVIEIIEANLLKPGKQLGFPL